MRTRATWSAAALAASGSLCAAASAQSFNVDVGGNGAPSDAFEGASGRGGTWIVVPAGAPGQPWPLLDVEGRTTSVTLTYAHGRDAAHDEPATDGDFEALLDDYQRFSGANTWTLAGLEPGFYQVFTYSWSPDRPREVSTRIDVVGAGEGEQEVGCAEWRGALVEGEQYARHHVMIGAGDALRIELEAGNGGLGAVNALQLVHLPVPGASGRTGDPDPDSMERLARDQDGTGLTSERAVRGRPHGGTAVGPAPLREARKRMGASGSRVGASCRQEQRNGVLAAHPLQDPAASDATTRAASLERTVLVAALARGGRGSAARTRARRARRSVASGG